MKASPISFFLCFLRIFIEWIVVAQNLHDFLKDIYTTKLKSIIAEIISVYPCISVPKIGISTESVLRKCFRGA